MPSPFNFFTYLDLSDYIWYCFNSHHLLCPRGQSDWQHIQTHIYFNLDFGCSCVKDALQNCRNITLTEQAKWAPFFEVFLWNKWGNPLAQRSYSIYVHYANNTGDAGQIHKRRSALENPANPWLKVHVLASMDKLWQIFPGKRSKEKKKATKLVSFLVKKQSQCQWQASKAHVCLSKAAFQSLRPPWVPSHGPKERGCIISFGRIKELFRRLPFDR